MSVQLVSTSFVCLEKPHFSFLASLLVIPLVASSKRWYLYAYAARPTDQEFVVLKIAVNNPRLFYSFTPDKALVQLLHTGYPETTNATDNNKRS